MHANRVDELRSKYFTPLLRSAAVLDDVCGSVTVHRVLCSETHALHVCKYFYAVYDRILDRVHSLTFLEQQDEQDEQEERKTVPKRSPPHPLRKGDAAPSAPELADSVKAALHCSGSAHPHARPQSLASSSRSTDYCLDATSVLLPNVCTDAVLTCVCLVFLSLTAFGEQEVKSPEMTTEILEDRHASALSISSAARVPPSLSSTRQQPSSTPSRSRVSWCNGQHRFMTRERSRTRRRHGPRWTFSATTLSRSGA